LHFLTLLTVDDDDANNPTTPNQDWLLDPLSIDHLQHKNLLKLNLTSSSSSKNPSSAPQLIYQWVG
jgi:hypothetical protein